VLVGSVVMVDQWPIAHQCFSCRNLRDATTVSQVVEDLEQRFGLGRVVFVGDRGMVTAANLRRLREHEARLCRRPAALLA
jgi:transposase